MTHYLRQNGKNVVDADTIVIDEFAPKSFLEKVSEGLVCYDLEFVSGEPAHVGYEFSHPTGLLLIIDASQDDEPMAMTLVHQVDVTGVQYQVMNDYGAFCAKAKESYVFALQMIALAKANKQRKVPVDGC